MPVRSDLPVVPRPEWPDGGVDAAALARSGWRPTPFRQYVLKIHSRCNLACDYCYMYAMADQGWRRQPRAMTRPTIVRCASRIAEAVECNSLDEISVIFHGGEPLLAGSDLISFAAAAIRDALPARTRLRLSLQTNGVLLTAALLDVLREQGISIGVSLDGDRSAHDRHRHSADGRSSYDQAIAGLALLRSEPYREFYAGILATIDLAADPLAVLQALVALDPPVLDLLLPHGNWSSPPPGRDPDPALTPYADWLIAVFDHWYGKPGPRIRLFEEIIHLCLGGHSRTEAIGLSPAAMIVISTDGSLEQVDTLRSAFDGGAVTGLNVFTSGFDAALAHPAIMARQIGAGALSGVCGSCSLRRICGGGYYPHRYRAGHGFRNPSVYCPDLMKLITHIRNQVSASLTESLAQAMR